MTHRIAAVLLVGFATATGVAQQPVGPTLSSPDEITAFATALDACKAGTAATPHPLMRGFVIEHVVSGEKAGACAYSQSMPGKMKMECGFSAAGRKAMAAEIRNLAAGGAMRGGTSQTQPAWATECEIVTAAGSRSPMVQPPRNR
jgi:hypothetical protein